MLKIIGLMLECLNISYINWLCRQILLDFKHIYHQHLPAKLQTIRLTPPIHHQPPTTATNTIFALSPSVIDNQSD